MHVTPNTVPETAPGGINHTARDAPSGTTPGTSSGTMSGTAAASFRAEPGTGAGTGHAADALSHEARPLPAGQPINPEAVISVRGLRKSFGRKEILHGLDFDIPANSICGLLGRNGAGKTTALSILSGQDRASNGEVSVMGRQPFEDIETASHLCFARENQKYPESFKAGHVLKSAPWFFESWDQSFAERLVRMFRLPVETKIQKLSRGQLSSVAIVVGLASRAPLTFFDEPYLGLDATARQLFYDVMLQDYLEHPRTIIMSTHLIDEAADLLEKVLVIDDGRILMDADADSARSAAFSLSGPAAAVGQLTEGRSILHSRRIGGLSSVTLAGQPDAGLAAAAAEQHLEIGPVGLQDLVAAIGSRPTDTVGEPATESPKESR
ncbi:ATP-binding cassette domain-containing protein [Citricoccus sp. K5]|uniref:ATP-binding cassette domain-containing protein n=1 Tax=Citricoccus sp. K5 TaxID=2653135 RepID=UPI0012F04FE1|nr:ABC transporter ATP-binding protein [Citricoccus sp. K5]VXB93824.1 ABC-2 type transport system ATP-binding protein [Citricoccus sp. K5]